MILAITPATNTPGKKDLTGAFLPEARHLCKLHKGHIRTFRNRKPKPARFEELMGVLAKYEGAGLSAVMFLCHGYRTGLQPGVTLENAADAARAVRATGARVCTLYACDAARDSDKDRADDMIEGPGGAGGVASIFARAGLLVDAHVTAAHTTINPFVRRFSPDDDSDAGDWIVKPRSALWRTWREALHDDRTFRLSFPFRSTAEIRADLEARKPARSK